MSRIGKLPIEIPKGVTITISDDNVVVKGPLGVLVQPKKKEIAVKVEDNKIILSRPDDSKEHKSLHGLYRSLINNMVIGVSTGYTVEQELVGVGYKAETKGQILELALGYSHNILFELPKEIEVSTKQERRANPIITLKSCDKQLIGHVSAKIRSLRPPEPYKGKGIRYLNEFIKLKAGKTAKA